ncbi:hypothetical protein [Helicobacter suis]|uniref:hypothetical protein n=1 Tax=Helicobacter suis TaxID=104628 RepID=UPI001596463A|nr:hypothetical protein [Helicobacter suis]BCD51944.1 hypothetical protein NHP194022_16150 [Helicobacter suis]
MQKPETEAQTEPLALTEGSYPLRKEEVLEWAIWCAFARGARAHIPSTKRSAIA